MRVEYIFCVISSTLFIHEMKQMKDVGCSIRTAIHSETAEPLDFAKLTETVEGARPLVELPPKDPRHPDHWSSGESDRIGSHERHQQQTDRVLLSSSEQKIKKVEPATIMNLILYDGKLTPEEEKRYIHELKEAPKSMHFGTNRHYYIPLSYKNYGRRFVPLLPYTEIKEVVNSLKPVKVAPELVLQVAKQSALFEKAKGKRESSLLPKQILRDGNYWDGVYVEPVDTKKNLRSGLPSYVEAIPQEEKPEEPEHRLNVVNLTLNPGTNLYQLVSQLKDVSPRFIYVINKTPKE